MYVTMDKNREYVLRFWQGKPSNVLLWKLMAPWSESLCQISHQQGYNCGDPVKDNLDFFSAELGCVTHYICSVTKTECSDMKIEKRQEDGVIILECKTQYGTFHEKIINGQIVEHMVKTENDLKAYTNVLRNAKVVPNFEGYLRNYSLYSNVLPFIVEPETASAVQQCMQYITGVANFWYLAQDCPGLLGEFMDVFQSLMAEKYRLMQQVPSDGFFQGENTSTTMISPEYYDKYGLPQVNQFVKAAHSCGKRAMVHMCGHLHDLMPLIAQTDMDGIHALTPEPIGNTSFEYAYSVMSPNTSIMGRFGAQEWIGKTKNTILRNLARILPHRIYQEYPFILTVTSDLEKFDIDDLYNMRDAVEEYQSQ